MHPAEWIALISPTLALAGIGYAAVAKLTRITVALEQTGRDIAAVAGRVDNHERRLVDVERNPRGRHRSH